MTQILNFQVVELRGNTKQEALEAAPFECMGDATQAYKNWLDKQVGNVTETDKKRFMLDYLAKKSKNVTGVGFYIIQEHAVDNSRLRPYEFTDGKKAEGMRKYKTTYQLIDKATGAVLASTTETKAKAKEIAKDLYKKKGFRGDLTCIYTKQIVDGEPVAFTVKYTPSKTAHPGTYIAFGIVR